MRVLRAKVQEQAQQAQNNEIAADRKSQVGSGDRSERIRTYNFPSRSCNRPPYWAYTS